MSSARMMMTFGRAGAGWAAIESAATTIAIHAANLMTAVWGAWQPGLRVCLEYFVDQKQVGEQRAYVDVRVQVVDHLRMDRWLREHHLHGGLRVFRIAVDDGDERTIWGRVGAEAADELREEVAEAGDGLV